MINRNTLDKGFYNELLYILGLEEVKEKTKSGKEKGNSRITRLPKEKRQPNAILEQIIDSILANQQAENEEKAFEIALELTITWLNRILFLKLLEAQLISWNPKEAENFGILTKKRIKSYGVLNQLFFQVLAVPNKNRSERLSGFKNVPYLNSSLFEESIAENKYRITIGNILNSPIKIYEGTILKNGEGRDYNDGDELNGLDYLFSFLEHYDFGIEKKDENFTTKAKTIINPSVLGMIFEKINGYKDGSYFTPSHVTYFMAKQTISKVLLNKFGNIFKTNFETLNEVRDYVGRDDRKKEKIRSVLDKFTVCDPAVGSGHFLVSALNYLVKVYYSFRLIFTDEGEPINNIVDLDVIDDEIVVLLDNRQFVYNPSNNQSNLIQKSLFKIKSHIIENSLFGVDINEKSVQIARLRLWIELLKHTFYEKLNGNYYLQTMPNIDINIKRGNSLICAYPIMVGKSATSLPQDLKVTKSIIKEYRALVKQYRNDANKRTKRELEIKIQELKYNIGIKRQLEFDFYETVSKKKQSKQDRILSQSFEWMLEFPDILDENGKFKGFEVVLVNPPYINALNMTNAGLDAERRYYESVFITAKGNWDIYIPFLERSNQLLSKSGACCCITPDKWLALYHFVVDTELFYYLMST